MKTGQVGTEFFREDGRTCMIKILVAFRNFENVPKDVSGHSKCTWTHLARLQPCSFAEPKF